MATPSRSPTRSRCRRAPRSPIIGRIDRLARGESDLEMSPLPRARGRRRAGRFKLCRTGAGIPLSDVLPVLENMGLRVHPRAPLPVRDRRRPQLLAARLRDASAPRPARSTSIASGTASRRRSPGIWRGDAQNDGFNQLVLGAGLDWREITVLRAYCKYLLQVGSAVQPGLHGADAGLQPGHRARSSPSCSRRASIPTCRRSRRQGRGSDRADPARPWTRSPISTRTASCGAICA